MSPRFLVNLVVLLLGAVLVVVVFAFSAGTVDAVGLVVGGLAVLAALISFALPGQGAYQRSADVVICVLGAWAIVAARVLSYNGRWLEFGAGTALAALGTAGLVAREASLAGRARAGGSLIGPDQLVRRPATQRDAA